MDCLDPWHREEGREHDQSSSFCKIVLQVLGWELSELMKGIYKWKCNDQIETICPTNKVIQPCPQCPAPKTYYKINKHLPEEHHPWSLASPIEHLDKAMHGAAPPQGLCTMLQPETLFSIWFRYIVLSMYKYGYGLLKINVDLLKKKHIQIIHQNAHNIVVPLK